MELTGVVNEKIQEIVRALKLPVLSIDEYMTARPNDMSALFVEGAYNKQIDTIMLCAEKITYEPFLSVERCLLHEIGHSTMHPNRINRPIGSKKVSECTAKEYHTEEMTAELFMYHMAKYLNMDVKAAKRELFQYSYSYPLADMIEADKDARAAMHWVIAEVNRYRLTCTSQQESQASPSAPESLSVLQNVGVPPRT